MTETTQFWFAGKNISVSAPEELADAPNIYEDPDTWFDRLEVDTIAAAAALLEKKYKPLENGQGHREVESDRAGTRDVLVMDHCWNTLDKVCSPETGAVIADPAYFRVDKFGNVVSNKAAPHSILYFAVDHVFPWARGGMTSKDNLSILQWKANGIKSDRLEFLIKKDTMRVGMSVPQFWAWVTNNGVCYDLTFIQVTTVPYSYVPVSEPASDASVVVKKGDDVAAVKRFMTDVVSKKLLRQSGNAGTTKSAASRSRQIRNILKKKDGYSTDVNAIQWNWEEIYKALSDGLTLRMKQKKQGKYNYSVMGSDKLRKIMEAYLMDNTVEMKTSVKEDDETCEDSEPEPNVAT